MREHLPVTISLVVLNIGEKRLIDVKDPRVLAVSANLDRFSVVNGVTSDYIVVFVELASVDVVFNIVFALGRNHLPGSNIVGLSG